MSRFFLFIILVFLLVFVQQSLLCSQPSKENSTNVRFKKHLLDADFVSEGVAVGDVNNDGKTDVLAGSFWYEAPSWKKHRMVVMQLTSHAGLPAVMP